MPDPSTTRLAPEAVALGDRLANYGIDVIDLDMIQRGDMLGSSLGQKVFQALAKLAASTEILVGPPELDDNTEARELAGRILQEPSSVPRVQKMCTDALVAARLRGEARAREISAGRIAALRANRQQLRLQLGEMSAQEMRTLTAGLQVAELVVRQVKG